MARKLWVASVVQGHRNPFGKPLTEYTLPQLDFVLEMAAIDDPDKWKFVRAGQNDSAGSTIMARWRDSLAGRALMELMALTGSTAAREGIARWRTRRTGGMRTGLTRGGKAIENATDRT